MEEFLVPSYHCGAVPRYFPFYPAGAKLRPQGWSKKGHVFGPADAPEYLDVYKRAQLKALLSQVNPSLTPRMRRANTRECGVQVNPKVDATVQCALGPKTLFYRGDERDCALPNTPLGSVRFSRPVAIYSPVFDRRIFSLTAAAESGNTDSDTEDYYDDDDDVVPCGRADESARDEAPTQRHKRSNFQFLEQKYGFYHCSKCNIRWESAFVWCISGTSKVYFKQHCRKCQAGLNPYRVESIQCQVCCKTRCDCERKQRHIDMRRPHRQDLCGRCKGKGLSCDTIYSFKYIV